LLKIDVLILLEKSILLIQNIKRKSNKPAKFNNEDFKGGSVTFVLFDGDILAGIKV